MTTVAPLYPVAGPSPRPRNFSLLKTAILLENIDRHSLAGVAVWPYPPSLPETFDACGTGTAGIKREGEGWPLPTFEGFTAYDAITCSTIGISDDDDFRDRAIQAFVATESFAVENALVTGGAKRLDNPYLADDNVTDPKGAALNTTAFGPAEALALLEDGIGRLTARMGLIHATPSTVVAWQQNFLVQQAGGLLTTILGTPIAVGDGYIDAVPDGTGALTADQQWAWATGPVEVRRSPAVELVPGTIAEALDRQQNVLTYRPERNYVVDWDTALQIAVKVDRSL